MTLDTPASFKAHVDQAKIIRERNLAKVTGYLTDTVHGQPMTVTEISDAIGVHTTTVYSYVVSLVKDGRVFARIETQDERNMRFGQDMKSARAMLYSTSNPVPTRTIPNQHADGAPSGVRYSGRVEMLARPGVSTSTMIRGVLSTRRYMAVHEIVEATGLRTDAVRTTMVALERKKVVKVRFEKIEGRGNRDYKQYALVKKETQPAPRTLDVTISVPAPKPAPPAVAPAAPVATATDTLDEAGDLFKAYVNSLVAEKTSELRSALDAALAKVAELEARAARARAQL